MSGRQTQQALGKYIIVGELGRGGFATVYRAQDTSLRRDVALKILHPALMADPAFVARFENDARATAQLDHPHITAIYELGQIEGRLYISMQLLSGGTLADYIRRRGSLPLVEAVQIVGEVAAALDHAHAAGFIHRDVKPSNILFNAHHQAVLADFGMVKAIESSVIARSTMGNVIGTPAYIAPEVWEDREAGPTTDVYALGCVLFEALTGELLFKGTTPPAVMRAHFQPHQYPERWPDGVPQEVEALLERALARDPAARYASAPALAADLRALAARVAAPAGVAQTDHSIDTALAPIARIWSLLALMIIGWISGGAFGGAIGGGLAWFMEIESTAISAGYVLGGAIGGWIGGATSGWISGSALRSRAPGFSRDQLRRLVRGHAGGWAGGWALTWAIYWLITWLRTTTRPTIGPNVYVTSLTQSLPYLWAIGGAVAGSMAALFTGMALRQLQPALRNKQIAMIASSGAVGGAAGGALAWIVGMLSIGVILWIITLISGESDSPMNAVSFGSAFGAVSGALFGAVGSLLLSGMLIWLLKRHRQRTQ